MASRILPLVIAMTSMFFIVTARGISQQASAHSARQLPNPSLNATTTGALPFGVPDPFIIHEPYYFKASNFRENTIRWLEADNIFRGCMDSLIDLSLRSGAHTFDRYSSRRYNCPRDAQDSTVELYLIPNPKATKRLPVDYQAIHNVLKALDQLLPLFWDRGWVPSFDIEYSGSRSEKSPEFRGGWSVGQPDAVGEQGAAES